MDEIYYLVGRDYFLLGSHSLCNRRSFLVGARYFHVCLGSMLNHLLAL